MRLIDADEFDAYTRELARGHCQNHLVDLWRGLIRRQPTVDAEPVRHGKWEFSSDGWVECSLCGETYPSDSIKPRYYCPNCGAKMDMD